MRKTLLLIITLCIPLLAQAKPSPEEVKNVIDYYFNGQDQGVVLADVKLCDEVYTEGEQKNECMDERGATTLAVGDKTYLWMLFMVPSKLDPQHIIIQLNRDDITLDVKNITITNSLRYRARSKIAFRNPGDWQVKILHDTGDKLELLKELKITVEDKPQTSAPN